MNTDHRRGESLSCFAWFVGKDVAQVLGYKDAVNAMKSHVDSEDKGVSKMDTPGGMQELTVIIESGDYLVCGIQAVEEVFGSFDGFSANREVFCDFVCGFKAGW